MLINNLEKNESVLIINGLSQKNVDGKGICIYRQKSPAGFLKSLNLKFKRVEQGMTNDGHIFFECEEDMEMTYGILKDARIKETTIFYVEKSRTEEFRLFYQCDFHDRVDLTTNLNIDNSDLVFLDYFNLLGVRERTGSHIPNGDIFYKGLSIPKQIYNHNLKSIITNYFNVKS